MISKLVVSSIFTSFYYIPEIYENANTIFIFGTSFGIQILHDFICFYFAYLLLFSMFYNSKLIELTLFYCSIMFLFSIYKRCVLTLLYNYILNIPSCTRYIPIWQRILKIIPVHCANNDPAYNTTLSWLNDHILQSGAMLFINLRWYLALKWKVKI